MLKESQMQLVSFIGRQTTVGSEVTGSVKWVFLATANQKEREGGGAGATVTNNTQGISMLLPGIHFSLQISRCFSVSWKFVVQLPSHFSPAPPNSSSKRRLSRPYLETFGQPCTSLLCTVSITLCLASISSLVVSHFCVLLPPLQVLLHNNIKFTALAAALNEIERTVLKAEAAYKMVLSRYPTNAKLARTYGRFLENVVNNPWKAVKYFVWVSGSGGDRRKGATGGRG